MLLIMGDVDFKVIDIDLLSDLIDKAEKSERERYAYDLRTSPEDTSQRMFNVLAYSHCP